MNSEPSWDLYKTFLAVLHEGSLSGAARSLGLAQPTVARHIDALEQALGFELFTRSQRGLQATETAAELQPYAESLAATAAAMLRAATPKDAMQGTVRLSASEVIAVEVLPPILAALHRQHPGLEIELVASNDLDNLLQRDADIAVRMVQPEQEALVCKHLGNITVGLYAHRDYLARRPAPETPADLADHSVIGFDRETPALRAMRARVPALRDIPFALRADSDLAQIAALRAGFGIGAYQLALAARHPDLVRILPDHVALPLPTWLVMHENLRSIPRYRTTFDHLTAGLTPHMDDP